MRHCLFLLLLTLAVTGLLNTSPLVEASANKKDRGFSNDSDRYSFLTGASYSFSGFGEDTAQGVSVSILTVVPQQFLNQDENSSYAFWVGAVLRDETFLQFGYEIHRGSLPTRCGQPINLVGCVGSHSTDASKWQWFWQFWPDQLSFKILGTWYPDIWGPSLFLDGAWGSPRPSSDNGTWNTYSIVLVPGAWSFRINGQEVDRVDELGISPDGEEIARVDAYGENLYAATNANPMSPVKFRDLRYCPQDCTTHPESSWPLVKQGKVHRTYAEGSATDLANPYAFVPEYGRNASFTVGMMTEKGADDGSLAWPQYRISVSSPYGAVSGSGWYPEGSSINIEPDAARVPDPMLGVLGVKRIFQGCSLSGPAVSQGIIVAATASGSCQIVVTGAVDIGATWAIDWTSCVPTLALLTLTILIIVVILVAEKYRNHRDRPISQLWRAGAGARGPFVRPLFFRGGRTKGPTTPPKNTSLPQQRRFNLRFLIGNRL
jgi:hypothetical protein